MTSQFTRDQRFLAAKRLLAQDRRSAGTFFLSKVFHPIRWYITRRNNCASCQREKKRRQLRVTNFGHENGQSCSRFAVRSATLVWLESERHASHRGAATTGRARPQLARRGEGAPVSTSRN